MLIQVVAHRSQYVSVSILVRATAPLIQVVAHRSQAVSVSIFVRATATLIQVVAHRSQYVSVSILVRATATLIQVVAHHSQEAVSVSILVRATATLIQVVAHRSQREELRDDHRVEIRSRLLSAASHSSPSENIVQLISAVVIIFEHSFYIFDKRRYLQDKESNPSFRVALEQYMASPHAAAVREAASAAVYPYQGKPPSWITKLPFESFKRKAKEKESAKAEFIEAVLEIALNHRLPRP
ncbi:uncharacterized protein HD556DRAFT_1462287 [Suillus plorans]|uniref:Uncharacterized protein n=1 Tax=Suillus plorans TaxID=116603 RepID=A0A9P7DMS6_9AGAM|nr:uncharacterized protein HD556DRAFT_1462287 [Suillus plorans]KAG1798596.1 hypothetical protein HD556DRAFT_1462287 [Suillus plorans]